MAQQLIQKPQKCSKEQSESNRTDDHLLETKADRWGSRFLLGNWRKVVFYTKPLHKHGDSERKNNLY